ncbi:MAG: hypothetical protein WKF66_14075 [Pedobacter sp.]
MKRFLPLFLLLTVLLCSCKNSSKSTSSTSKSDATIKIVPEEINVDRTANRDMMIILSILPDTLSRAVQWTRAQRGYMRRSVEQNGYLVDSNEVFKSVNIFKNNHIDLNMPDGRFLLTTYQISDGHYVILTVETIKEKQTVKAYELYKSSAAALSLDDLLGKYSLSYMVDPSNQSCLGMLYDKSPDFDFLISENDEVKIKIKNYSEDDSKGCLKGNLLTLKFNRVKMPFDITSLTWEN